jgi:hypothetical protein
MNTFNIGDSVSVLPNTFSKHAADHREPEWTGTIRGVHKTPAASGMIVSFDVAPNDGGLPRNVLESRLKPF